MTTLRSLTILVPAILLGFVAHATRGAAPRSAQAIGTVLFTLSSAEDGGTVKPGQAISWQLTLESNGATHFGLAGFTVDLIQNEGNPELFDLPPGAPLSPTMLGFDRPLGFSNPGPEPKSSGFGGVPTGKPGARNLEQIGGMQNTFGIAPDCLGPQADICAGQRVQVDFGVTQVPGGEVVAAGSFPAPRTPGSYVFALSKPQATVLTQLNTPPLPSGVESAACTLLSDSFSFQVQ